MSDIIAMCAAETGEPAECPDHVGSSVDSVTSSRAVQGYTNHNGMLMPTLPLEMTHYIVGYSCGCERKGKAP